MHASVQFDRKLASVAIEIDNVSRDRLLTPEMEPVKPVSTWDFTENALRRGHIAAQSFGERQMLGRNTLDAGYSAAMRHKRLTMPKNLTPNPFPRGKGNRIERRRLFSRGSYHS